MIAINALVTILAICGLSTALGIERRHGPNIDFQRFAHDCGDKKDIGNIVHLHGPHCKTFAKHEAPFQAFKYWAHDKKDEVRLRTCQLFVYAAPHCEGEGFTAGHATDTWDQCNTWTGAGRSVYVDCDRPKVGAHPPGPVGVDVYKLEHKGARWWMHPTVPK